MLKIALINMPFASVGLPSIALTQLKSVLDLDPDVHAEVEVYYLNHDFKQYFGHEQYALISESVNATVTGLGDWLFRLQAFPDLEDNTEEYFGRHLMQFKSEIGLVKTLVKKREGLDHFLDDLVDRYGLQKNSVVGFTSMFAQNTASFAMARKIKQHNANAKTIMGGANCETSMGAVIARNVEAIDFVFSGPALKNFPRFIKYVADGKLDECHDIKGVFSKHSLARHSMSGASEIGDELDIEADVPLDYEGYFNSLAQKLPDTKISVLFETSRGCWWGERSHCTFCGLNGNTMKYRAMSPEKALDQFDKIFQYYPRVTHFKSVDNILPREYLTTVLPYMRPPGNATVFYELKADLKDREMEVLANAGIRVIQPGIEAMATATLKLMKKGTTSFHNLRFLKNCLTYSIDPIWNLLIGFPGEHEEVYEKYAADLPLLVHLPPPTGVFPVRFDRFSPYYQLAKDYGLKLRAYDFYSMVYPFSRDELEKLAYFFSDQNYSNDYLARSARWISTLRGLVDQWRDRWDKKDGESRPSLSILPNGGLHMVRDTRSGSKIEHELDPVGVEILRHLAEPKKFPRVMKEMSDISEAELELQFGNLKKHGLIFEDDDRFMSLTLEQDQGKRARVSPDAASGAFRVSLN